MNNSFLEPTQYDELCYEQVGAGLWRIIDASTGRVIGPHYDTREELLADLDHFAEERGCTKKP